MINRHSGTPSVSYYFSSVSKWKKVFVFFAQRATAKKKKEKSHLEVSPPLLGQSHPLWATSQEIVTRKANAINVKEK